MIMHVLYHRLGEQRHVSHAMNSDQPHADDIAGIYYCFTKHALFSVWTVMGHVMKNGLDLIGTGRTTRLDPEFKADFDRMVELSEKQTGLSASEKNHVKALQLFADGSVMLDNSHLVLVCLFVLSRHVFSFLLYTNPSFCHHSGPSLQLYYCFLKFSHCIFFYQLIYFIYWTAMNLILY